MYYYKGYEGQEITCTTIKVMKVKRSHVLLQRNNTFTLTPEITYWYRMNPIAQTTKICLFS